MNMKLTKIKQFLSKLRNFLPSALPRGMSDFDSWSDDVISTYDLPANDSIKFALATMILHLGPTDSHKSKRYFAKCVLKGMSAQVASSVMYTLKEKQKAEEVAAKQLAEAPANSQVAANVQSVSN